MKSFSMWGRLGAMLVVVAAVMFCLPHTAHAHSASTIDLLPYVLPGVLGLTTGTEAAGPFGGLNDMLKQVYTKPFENNIEKESEVADLINQAEGFEVIDGPDGKAINIGHIFSSGGGVGAINEDDYLYTPTLPTTKQSSVTIPILTAVVELSGKTLRRVKKGPAAFVTWADEALPRKAQRLAFHKDRMYLGTGTGIIARYSANPPTGTADGITSSFGIASLEAAEMMVLRDDSLRAGPNADGSALRAGTAIISRVDMAGKTISTTVAGVAGAPTSAALNDYLFLGDANVNGSGAREMMGLEGIIDDGTNIATFQTLSRTTFPEMKGQVIDSSANGFTQNLSEEILDFADAQCYERGNMGKPSVIFAARSGQRSFWKTLKGDRVLNDPRGSYTGGKVRLQMQLGDRVVTVAAARKCPLSRCYGIDTSSVLRFRNGAGRWDDTDGAVFNRVVDGNGRKDAFFAVYIEEEQVGAGDPAKNFKITNLLAA